MIVSQKRIIVQGTKKFHIPCYLDHSSSMAGSITY